MAVNPPPAPEPVVLPPAPPPTKADPTPVSPLVQNTVVDPLRKWTAAAAFAAGLALEVLSAVVAAFHFGDSTPLMTTGAALFAAGVAILWDRQIPA